MPFSAISAQARQPWLAGLISLDVGATQLDDAGLDMIIESWTPWLRELGAAGDLTPAVNCVADKKRWRGDAVRLLVDLQNRDNHGEGISPRKKLCFRSWAKTMPDLGVNTATVICTRVRVFERFGMPGGGTFTVSRTQKWGGAITISFFPLGMELMCPLSKTVFQRDASIPRRRRGGGVGTI